MTAQFPDCLRQAINTDGKPQSSSTTDGEKVTQCWVSKLNYFVFLRLFCIRHHKTAAHGYIDTNRNFSLSSGMSCHILLHIVTTIPEDVDELLKQFWIACHPNQEHTEILRMLLSWIHCCRSQGTKKTVPGHWEEKLQLQNLRTVEPKLWPRLELDKIK